MAGEWGAPRKQVRDAVDPSGFGGAEERLRIMEARIAKLEHGAFSEFVSFGLDGIKISGGGSLRVLDGGDVVVDPDGMVRSALFDGDLGAGEVGTTGWAMDDTAAALPNLLLRPGSVGNEALANPTKPGSIYAYATGFGLSTTHENILTATIPVPDGFTIAHVTVTGRVFAYNNTAGLDYLSGEANIAGSNGWGLPLAVSGSGGSGTNVSTFTKTLTGLVAGATFDVQMAAWATFASWATKPDNTVELSGSITWYR